MQSNAVKAFRQRLIRAGFTDIHIDSYPEFKYIILYCDSPEGIAYKRKIDFEMIPFLPYVKYWV